MSDTNDQVRLLKVRLSFPDLFKAKVVNKGEPKFGASFLLDKEKDAKQILALKKMIAAVAGVEFGENAVTMIKKGHLKICLHEGDEKDYEGYDDTKMFISTSSTKRPTVVDRDRSPLTEEDDRPYAGCFVNAVFRIWAQNNEFGKRINAQLQGVQYVSHGARFGAAPIDADEVFPDLSDEEEETSDEAAGADEAEKPEKKPKAAAGKKKAADPDEAADGSGDPF